MINKVWSFFGQPSESEIKVLGHIVRSRQVTQPAIVKATNLSQQTVSRLVNELETRGALKYGQKQTNGKRGQPSINIGINPNYAYSLGIALMTDAMSILLMDFAGQVVDYKYIAMPVMSRVKVFEKLDITVNHFITKHAINRENLFGAGIGISGYCLDGQSRYNPPRALDDWAMVPIDKLFSEALGVPSWVENDGNAAAIGESLLGVGRSYSDFVYLFMAAGIGGGVIANHRLHRGVHGNGGEIGLILPRNVYQLPTLETLRQSIARNGIELNGISDMLERFDPAWPGIEEWIERSRDPLSLIVSSIAALLDPEAIILGGRLPISLAERIIPTIELYDNARRTEPRALPKLMLSQTEVDACAIGAAMLPLEQNFFSTML